MATPVSEIDYRWLADLSERHGIEFVELCRRAEEKDAKTEEELMGRDLIKPDADWVLSEQAATILNVSKGSVSGLLASGTLPYFGIEWRSRSRHKPDARRGCGVLLSRKDLERVCYIREVLDGTAREALKVFQAMRQGLL